MQPFLMATQKRGSGLRPKQRIRSTSFRERHTRCVSLACRIVSGKIDGMTRFPIVLESNNRQPLPSVSFIGMSPVGIARQSMPTPQDQLVEAATAVGRSTTNRRKASYCHASCIHRPFALTSLGSVKVLMPLDVWLMHEFCYDGSASNY